MVNLIRLLNQRKLTAILLVAYWLILIIFTHIPMPRIVEKAEISDKSLHFLAYLVLTFLFWFTYKPNQKVNWGKTAVWITLCIITLYGAADERVQSYFGRTSDIKDIYANVAGVATGLIIFTFFSFRPAALLVTMIVIFGVTNITQKNSYEFMPYISRIFDFFAYVVLTMLWIWNISNNPTRIKSPLKYTILVIIPPVIFLLLIKAVAIVFGRSLSPAGIIVPFGAIVLSELTFYFIKQLYRDKSRKVLN